MATNDRSGIAVYPSAPSISPQPEPKTSSQPKRSFTSSMRLRPNLVQGRIGWCQGCVMSTLYVLCCGPCCCWLSEECCMMAQ
ncbi:hypothetical protein KC19_1G220100 [Ceratodon purpureus]|uniref:Uncharacterized protein n=1 Tax=Ceratodon purpureus TaxID=3225 RepID=A0A8T0JBF7_CERPU|nr:hypothetical protein KC19_1G220100 [Ceratodon purpureus]KAG0592041.1 hypothetical protein KC19_1G220100 [Ceratodon purpureus]